MAAAGAGVSSLQLLLPGADVLLDAVRGLPGVGLLAPAHISLGYPWLGAQEALAEVERVRAAAASVPPFRAELTGPYRFAPDGRGRVVVHVRPLDDAPVRVLGQALQADLRDVHLSVARVLADGDLEAVEAAVRPLLPLRTEVRELELTVQSDGRWLSVLRAPLGGPPAAAPPTGCTPAAPR